MDRRQIIQICRERFDGWTLKLANDQATPQICVGVSHGHDQHGNDVSGRVVVVMVDDASMTNSVAAGFLRHAADLLDQAT